MPSRVPTAAIDKLLVDIVSVVSSEEFADKVAPLGVFPKSSTPRELDEIIRKEIDRWATIAKAANITVD